MVPSNGIRQQITQGRVALQSHAGAPGRMIDSFGAALQPGLKRIGVLAQVMQEPGTSGQLLAPKGLGKACGQFAHGFEVFGEALPGRWGQALHRVGEEGRTPAISVPIDLFTMGIGHRCLLIACAISSFLACTNGLSACASTP